MNILLVEDDASIVSALTDLLHSEGFSVQACATQDAACEALARTTFDIALLDVTLPQGNGFAVCAAAREAAPEMPVIFLTASDDEYSTVAGLDMGAVDYIAKPFRARELVSRIRSALRRAHPAESALLVGGRSRRSCIRGCDQGGQRTLSLCSRIPLAALLLPA